MDYKIRVHHRPKDYYENGKSFLNAAFRCCGQKENGEFVIINHGKMVLLPAPTVVNAAFACEMFLKAMLVNDGIIKFKNHSLLKLYDLLSEDTHKKICSYFDDESGEPFLRKQIAKHPDDFVDIRYYVENEEWGQMDPTAVVTLAYNLSEITKFVLGLND